uniref:Protein kinase domain-containing protein n=1 Tax=Parascaris univalens TaxID=6257 RepID=A0A915C774_PARUN
MDKLGRVWNRLSTRRPSHFGSSAGLKDEDGNENAPPDTKKEVFELFAKTATGPKQHRASAISTNSACGDTSGEDHKRGSSSKMRSVPGGRPSTPRGRTSRHRSSSPNHNHELNLSSLPMSASMSASPGGTSMTVSQHTMITTEPNSTDAAQLISPTHTPHASNRLAVPGAAQEISSSQMSSNDRSLVPDTKTPHTTFAPTYVQTDNVEISPVTVTQFSEPHNQHSEDVSAKLNHRDVHVCADSVQATSTSAFKEQTKRRNSVFIKRGSITMEPIKRVKLDDVYAVYKHLGTGRFGSIKLAQHRESKHKIAMKFFPRPQTKQVDFIREYNYSFFLSPHPNIIDTYEGAYQTDDESAFFFVQEICPCSSLREAVETSQNGIGESATKSIMGQVLAAIEFMHSENLVHRNLKAENVLIFDTNFSKVKVTDFGLTRKVDSTVKYLEYVNSYHAPELCETVVNEVLIVHRSIDIWAIGIIFYYCLKGRFPWQKATIMCKPYWEWEQWLKGKNPLLPKRFEPFSEKSLKLLKRTLNPRSKDRWSVKDVKKCIMKEKLLKPQKVPSEE